MLPPEMVSEDTEPPFPAMQFEAAVSDAGAMSMVALAPPCVAYDPVTVPSVRSYPSEVLEAPLKVTLEGLRPGQEMVNDAPVFDDSNTEQALLLNFVGFSFTPEALEGPPEGDVVQLEMTLPDDFSVSFVAVAVPGTSGGLKVMVAVKVLQVIVPEPAEVFADATGPLTVSSTIGSVTRAATIRDERRKRICFPPRESRTLPRE
jgi:hypothetical protein